MQTKLLYMEDFTVLQSETIVVDVGQENDKDIVILDQTVFYSQGGGQPYDKGIISSDTAEFEVEEVRYVDGVVKHIGRMIKGQLTKEEVVTCKVEEKRRLLNSRLHTAGHLIDLVVFKLKPGWIPVKGFHFPDGPYIEYKGSVADEEKEQLKNEITNQCNQHIANGMKIKAVFMDEELMHTVCHFVPENIPKGKPARVIIIGDFGVPCGGTHVKDVREIKNLTIRKIKSDNENVRISYDVER